jgi:hypothetical protein
MRRMRYREGSNPPVDSTHLRGHAAIDKIIFICGMLPNNNKATQMLLSIALFMAFLCVRRKNELQNSAE